MTRGTKPWSSSPWTDGGRRTNEARTPRDAIANVASSDAMRNAAAEPGSGASSSAPRQPGVRRAIPEVVTKGRLEPASAEPSASIARRSVSAAAGKSTKSWMKAVWITPSQARAPAARLSVSDRSPLCASTPNRANVSAAASVRAKPST